jgi:hypothetical protein
MAAKERKDRKKIGIAAKRHKRRKKSREKFSQPNPRYGDHSERPGSNFRQALAESYLALSLRSLCSFVAIPVRWPGPIPPFLRLLCLFAAISVLF